MIILRYCLEYFRIDGYKGNIEIRLQLFNKYEYKLKQ